MSLYQALYINSEGEKDFICLIANNDLEAERLFWQEIKNQYGKTLKEVKLFFTLLEVFSITEVQGKDGAYRIKVERINDKGVSR